MSVKVPPISAASRTLALLMARKFLRSDMGNVVPV
jgi:hypothetical protein